jgi:hypothetical protein
MIMIVVPNKQGISGRTTKAYFLISYINIIIIIIININQTS